MIEFNRVFVVILINLFYLSTNIKAVNVSLSLTVQNSGSFPGPTYMGINMVINIKCLVFRTILNKKIN